MMNLGKASGKNSKDRLELEIAVKGAEHGTFSDQAFLYGELVRLGVLPAVPVEIVGRIDGKRALEVEGSLREFPKFLFFPFLSLVSVEVGVS